MSLGSVGRYRLVRRLAFGGMAEVFLATTDGPGGFEKDVAVKRVLPQFSSDEGFTQLFLDEARVAARLAHPNVVQVFDFGEEAGTYFLAMELLDGADLATILKLAAQRGELMPLPVASFVAAEVAAGLDYAHTLRAPASEGGGALSLVHRDVAPSNIFLTRHGQVKVLDFGIAKAEGQLHKTSANTIKGKHAYVSPEQVHGRELTAQSDLWAVGATLYEMTTGKRPFDRGVMVKTLMAVVEDNIPSPRQLRPDMGVELEAVIMGCLERDLQRRYPSGARLRADLRETMGTFAGTDIVAAYVRYLLDDGPAPVLWSSGPSAPAWTPAPAAITGVGARPGFAGPDSDDDGDLDIDVMEDDVIVGELIGAPDLPETISASDDSAGVVGKLDQLGIAEVIQMLELGRKTAHLEVKPKRVAHGRIEFVEGVAVLAVAGELRGEEAFYELCRAREGTWCIRYEMQPSGHEINAPTSFLLLEAMRRMDEENRPQGAEVPKEPSAFSGESGRFDVGEAGPRPAPSPPAPSPPAPSRQPPGARQRTLCGYLVERELGTGGTGIVYRARKSEQAEPVALKVLTRASAGDEDSVKRFQREVHAHSNLRHPNVVGLLDSGVHEGTFFLVTELVEGSTLGALLEAATRLPTAVAVLIFRDILAALTHTHARQVIHRDLAPKNVLLSESGQVKLSDFGFARDETDPDRSTAGAVVGTYEYMSPEQGFGLPVDPRSDLFTAGTILVEMLSGQHPFRRETAPASLMAVCQAKRPSLLVQAPGAPLCLSRIADRLQAREASGRYASAQDVLEALAPLASIIENRYPNVLSAFVRDPEGMRRMLDADQARLEVGRAKRLLASGLLEVKPQAGLALLRARELNPIDPMAKQELAALFEAEGWTLDAPPDEEERSLEALLEDTPDDLATLRRLYAAQRARGALPQAAQSLARCAALFPEDAMLARELSTLTGEDPIAPFDLFR